MIKCEKCGSTDIEIKRDSRGLPDAYCKECGSHIKKMSMTEVLDYYEAAKPPELTAEEAPTDRPPCKYCKERYEMVQGRRDTREVRVPIDIKFCPMCGRERKADDLKYGN